MEKNNSARFAIVEDDLGPDLGDIELAVDYDSLGRPFLFDVKSYRKVGLVTRLETVHEADGGLQFATVTVLLRDEYNGNA